MQPILCKYQTISNRNGIMNASNYLPPSRPKKSHINIISEAVLASLATVQETGLENVAADLGAPLFVHLELLS